MPPTLKVFGTSVGLSILWNRLAPQYAPGNIVASVILFFALYPIYAAWVIVVYPRFFSPLRHLPQAPNAHPLLGQTQRIWRESQGAPMRDWVENVPNDGLIHYTMLFGDRILVTSPSALSEVLVTKNYDFVKPGQFKAGLGQILGMGVLFAEGDEHKFQRKNLSPAFSFRHIKDSYPAFWAKSREMVECITRAIQSGEVSVEDENDEKPVLKPGTIDVGMWTSRATLDIIGVSGMGRDFNALQDPTNKLFQTYTGLFKNRRRRADRIQRLAALLIPFSILTRIPLKRNTEMREAVEYVKQTCRDLIAKKRQIIAEKGRSDVDLLSVALESGAFSDENLLNQIMTFLLAGHETTSTALIWAMLTLSKHPAVQQKLREEVRAHIPSLQSDITASDIDNCHYLQAVCAELLRVWPPVPMTMRVAARDTSISGQFVPKGTTVVLAPWAINTSTHLWGPDALEFRPERWIDADGKANHQGGAKSNFAFMTFLHGPRGCIGERFSRAEFACLLAAWIGTFDTSLEENSPFADADPEIMGGVTAKPKGGLRCQVKEVPGW